MAAPTLIRGRAIRGGFLEKAAELRSSSEGRGKKPREANSGLNT